MAKLGKLVRLVRLIKLFRISRIYKSFSKESKPKDSTTDTRYKPKDNNSKKESRVGAKLSEMATKTVILLVFVLLILLPLFDADFWTNTASEADVLCQQLQFIIATLGEGVTPAQLQTLKYSDSQASFSGTTDTLQAMLAFTVRESIPDIASKSLGPVVKIVLGAGSASYYGGGHEYTVLRYEEMNYSTCGDSDLVQVFQQDTSESTLESALGIGRTLYICFLLLGGAAFFSRSAHDLVIGPIERMIDKVISVIENPQKVKEDAFVTQEEKEFKQFIDKFDHHTDALATVSGVSAASEATKLETAFLEEAIDKICVLLGVGLGEAGTELINSYLNKETDLMNVASQIDAVFAFCDIRNFTDATEILQEEVMVFVNTIAEIVHSQADESLGAANKNVGDAFLIVWRVGADDAVDIDVKGIDQDTVNTNLCELAFYSVLTMIAEIGRAFELKRFADNPTMKERIGDNFKVRLGFGMHFGWAIEGALGSQFKVDVTYLSPHVNMAVRLEGETKRYGTGLLMTGEFVDKLSSGVRVYCRQIDIMENPDGSILRLYTGLISEKSLKYPTIKGIDSYRMKTKERAIIKKVLRNDLISGNLVGRRLFQNDKNIALLITGVHPKLSSTFFEAFQSYKRGDFAAAKLKFEEVLKLDPDDGPSKFLLQVVESFKGVKPVSWNGIRKSDDSGGH